MTPLAVAEDDRLLGVIKLEDILKPGIQERFAPAPADGPAGRDGHWRQPTDGQGDRQPGGR